MKLHNVCGCCHNSLSGFIQTFAYITVLTYFDYHGRSLRCFKTLMSSSYSFICFTVSDLHQLKLVYTCNRTVIQLLYNFKLKSKTNFISKTTKKIFFEGWNLKNTDRHSLTYFKGEILKLKGRKRTIFPLTN